MLSFYNISIQYSTSDKSSSLPRYLKFVATTTHIFHREPICSKNEHLPTFRYSVEVIDVQKSFRTLNNELRPSSRNIFES